ncbi:hypothetical protein V3C99_004727 [Haemonchus contortus]
MALNALHRHNHMIQLKDLKWLDLFEKLKLNADDFQARLRSQGLQAVPVYPMYSRSINIRPPDYVWIYRKCACRANEGAKPSLSVLHGSFSANSKLPESTSLQLPIFGSVNLDPSKPSHSSLA